MNSLFETKSLLVLVTGIFTAGFLGSWHCAFMCGPMACYLANKKKLMSYQIGRLISYVLFGVFAGYIMQQFVSSYEWMKYFSVFFLSAILIYMALKKNSKIMTPKYFSQYYFRFRDSGFLLGLFSVLLPCGWLYTFIMSASASRSPFGGGLVMGIFWVSTLPALTVSQIFLKKLINKSNEERQKISSYVLLFASLYSLGTFLFLH